MEYGTDEAKDLLARKACQLAPHQYLSQRLKATGELLNSAVKMGKELTETLPDVRIYADGPGVVSIQMGRRVISMVRHDDDGSVVVFNPGTKDSTPVPVEFNALTSSWEGSALDKFKEPEPGKARPRRSALAVLLETALSELG